MGEYITIRDENGRFLPGTQPPGKITNPTQAQAMARKRWDAAATRAAEGMSAGVKAVRQTNPAVFDGLVGDLTTGDTDQDAWAVLHAVTAMQVLQSDRPQPDALQVLGRNARMIPSGKDGSDPASDTARSIAAGMVDALLDRLERVAKDAEKIDE